MRVLKTSIKATVLLVYAVLMSHVYVVAFVLLLSAGVLIYRFLDHLPGLLVLYLLVLAGAAIVHMATRPED